MNLAIEAHRETDGNQKAKEEEVVQTLEDRSDVQGDEDTSKLESDMKKLVEEFCDYVHKRTTNKNKPVIWYAQDNDPGSVLQIVFPRLTFALARWTNPFNKDLIGKVISHYHTFIESTMESSRYQSVIAKLEALHVSRALIDTDDACLRSLNHLTKATTCSLFELKDWRKELFDQAKAFYLKILLLPLARSAIEKTFNSLAPSEWSMTRIFEEFKTVVEKVIIVDRKART